MYRQQAPEIGTYLHSRCFHSKNAFRATVEEYTPKKEAKDPDVFTFDDLPHAHLSKSDFPEIVISIGVVPGVLTLRIRDRGGGVRESLPSVLSLLIRPSVSLGSS